MNPSNHSTKISKLLRAVSVPSGTTGSAAARIWRSPTARNTNHAEMPSVAVAVCAGNRLRPGMIDTHVNPCSTSAHSFHCAQLMAPDLTHTRHQEQRDSQRETHTFNRQTPEQHRQEPDEQRQLQCHGADR